MGNGQNVTRSYNMNYALTDITSPAFTLHLARDAMGRVSAIGNTSGANPATETYEYDALHRLTTVTKADGTSLESYTYNGTGDRLSKAATDQVTGGGTYMYAQNTHQLASIGNGLRSNDANGNTTASVMGGNAYGFDYNEHDQIATAKLNGQTVGTYAYNALGQRVAKAAIFPQTVAERYAYNEADQLVGEYGNTNRDYIWLGALPVAVIDNSANGSVTASDINYVIADQLGTPRSVTNSAGAVIWSWAYQSNPFGEQAPLSATGYAYNLRYPGQYFDAETNTNFNHFRTYEPATGRYLQSDPIGLGGGTSTYAYVGSDPLNGFDPGGLVKWTGSYGSLGGGAIGGSYFDTYDLTSECVDGEKAEVQVWASGGALGAAPSVLWVTSSGGPITFDDGLSSLNPDGLAGQYRKLSYGAALGFGVGGSWIDLGDARSVTLFGRADGLDYSAWGTVGFSWLHGKPKYMQCGCR
ncbi:RHS repeat-associated core domain-containing protein [Rhodanobacter lindaniclasticus]